jgi:hypothetical protein
VEAHEAADHIQSAVEQEKAEHEREAHFRSRVAILIAVLAALLAIAAVIGEKANIGEINANVDAADTRSTYDARTTQLVAERETIQSQQEQLADASLPADVRALVQQHLQDDQALASRLQSDPAQQDGIAELEPKLRAAEQEQQINSARGDSEDLAQTLLQIAIVIASVAILIISLPLAALASALGIAGVLLLLNGLTLLLRV